MASADDIHGVVFKNGSAILLARVVGAAGTPITQSSLTSAKYTAYLIDDHDPDGDVAITGHTAVDIDPISGLIFNTLQEDDLWGGLDETGYNFKHVLDVSEAQVFTLAGRSYRIVFTLTPTSGQIILVRFRVAAE